MRKPLGLGVYDHVLTRALAREVGAAAAPVQSEVDAIDHADVADILSTHVAREVARLLDGIPVAERAVRAAEIANRILAALPTLLAPANVDAEALTDAEIEPPARRLLALFAGVAPERPLSPLGTSTLFTRGRGEPGLGSELSREIKCADRVDALVAFITVAGVRTLREALDHLAQRAGASGAPVLRILTTTFTGATEVAAIEALARLPGARVKVSYDTRRTRLHAKAWLFHRDTGLSTAYVGSANLTAPALGSGHEWMLKVSQADQPHVVEKFAGTFETLWSDDEFEAYDPEAPAHRERLAAALGDERRGRPATVTLFAIRPYPFQEAILDRLRVEREVLGHRRNLVVAATGTGKTVVAAFDYARQVDAHGGVRPRLLFIAHRVEILEQARDTFRNVLHDAAFGELHGGGHESRRGEHVFASIQSARALLERFPDDHWQHVVVDECHHAPASSYREVMERLRPGLLVGLTATPERTDGRSLLPDFDDRIAAELRLWHAMDQQLLVPFEYYGLADGTDLTHIEWTRTGYSVDALTNVYTADDRRARLVLRQLAHRVSDVRAVRGLGFCVSVEHAEFMARAFTEHGVPSLALHGGSPDELRDDARRRLLARDVNFVFTCDLYNEGVDLPYVDALLLLRPTTSATLFMQQIGRGLRLHQGKTACLVLDFIGQHRKEFRFDTVLSALAGIPRAKLAQAVEGGFPFLPSGCTLSLDAVASEQVLSSLRRAVRGAERLATELRELSTDGRDVGLAEFLTETSRQLSDVYTEDFGWAKVRRLAGLAPESERAEEMSRRFTRLLHVDEPARLRPLRDLAMGGGAAQAQRYVMLDAQLNHEGMVRAAEEAVAYLRSEPTAARELADLATALEENVATAEDVYPIAEWPLALHRHYEPREVLAAVGRLAPGTKKFVPVGGVMKVGDTKRELMFVTLDKSDRGFSPTTRYRDYAISRDRFHWETQATVSSGRASGRRYTESPDNGWSFYMFVRADRASPYAFLGPVTYVSHSGDRPIAIVWKLQHPMPAALFDEFALLAQA